MPDATSALNASESASWSNFTPTECLRRTSQVHNFQGEDVPEQLKYRGSDSSLLFISRPDSVQLQRKSGKVSRSGSGCSKRPRIAQMEDISGQGGHNNVNGISDTLGSYPTKYAVPGNFYSNLTIIGENLLIHEIVHQICKMVDVSA